ncbi:MAG: argininosuccinate lyase [Acidobacteria bacterium]|nr:argininosuccinate lyase [Acidobacteriota bacterium]
MGLLRDRFGDGAAARMQAFASSLEVDLEMIEQDITGSLAHVRMLGEVGVLEDAEVEALVDGLTEIGEELASGTWVPTDEHEDIHMAVEARLTEKVGAVGGKLHTARSRNDQVATDVRLWLQQHVAEVRAALIELMTALLDRVEADGSLVIPGYTHLQRGQPILLGHHLLAHAWAIARDIGRLDDAWKRANRSPLGACAMAGTGFPIDRDVSADLLGLGAPIDNAMDAVASRDHALEISATCAIACTHMSRIAEELVLWSTAEFALVRHGDSYSTGSSIMPQKRNADAAELVRGRAARVQGDLAALLSLLRGQPMAYNRDLQEDRRALFDAVRSTHDSARVLAGTIQELQFVDRFEDELHGDFSLATEIADALAGAAVPFREAHGISARMVRWCEEHGCNLAGMPVEVTAEFHASLPDHMAELLDPRAATARRTSRGGTAQSEVDRQVAALRQLS